MDVPHSMLAEEVLKVASYVVSGSALSAKSLNLLTLVSGAGLVVSRSASSIEGLVAL